MVRVFNHKRTYRLEANGDAKDFMILRPLAFADVPEKYTGDITFQAAVKAGEIEIITTKAQAEKVEKKANETETAAKKPVKKSNKDDAE